MVMQFFPHQNMEHYLVSFPTGYEDIVASSARLVSYDTSIFCGITIRLTNLSMDQVMCPSFSTLGYTGKKQKHTVPTPTCKWARWWGRWGLRWTPRPQLQSEPPGERWPGWGRHTEPYPGRSSDCPFGPETHTHIEASSHSSWHVTCSRKHTFFPKWKAQTHCEFRQDVGALAPLAVGSRWRLLRRRLTV